MCGLFATSPNAVQLKPTTTRHTLQREQEMDDTCSAGADELILRVAQLTFCQPPPNQASDRRLLCMRSTSQLKFAANSRAEPKPLFALQRSAQ